MPYYVKNNNVVFDTELSDDTVERLLLQELDKRLFSLSELEEQVDIGLQSCMDNSCYTEMSYISEAYSLLLDELPLEGRLDMLFSLVKRDC